MEQVTPQYILDQMQVLGLHRSDLMKDLKINGPTISSYLSGYTNLSKAGKAMFYYYFKFKKLENDTRTGRDR